MLGATDKQTQELLEREMRHMDAERSNNVAKKTAKKKAKKMAKKKGTC